MVIDIMFEWLVHVVTPGNPAKMTSHMLADFHNHIWSIER